MEEAVNTEGLMLLTPRQRLYSWAVGASSGWLFFSCRGTRVLLHSSSRFIHFDLNSWAAHLQPLWQLSTLIGQYC